VGGSDHRPARGIGSERRVELTTRGEEGKDKKGKRQEWERLMVPVEGRREKKHQENKFLQRGPCINNEGKRDEKKGQADTNF